MSTVDYDQDPELALALKASLEEEERKQKQGGKTEILSEYADKLHSITFNAQLFGNHLLPGFKELWNYRTYSDITLIVGSEKLAVHKLVLCSWSETFRVMLENENWKESRQPELPVHIDEKEVPLFKKMIMYMYTGSIEVVYDEVIPLLALANYYSVIPLKDECGEILGSSIDEDNVFYLLEIVNKYSCLRLNTECAEFLAENFGDMLVKDKLMQLDVETWAEMLKSDDLQVSSEEDIVEALLRYANQFDKEKRIQVLEKTLPYVRFVVLSNEFLIEKVENNELLKGVPGLHRLLHLTYRYKAYPTSTTELYSVKPRRGSVMFDKEHSNPSVTLSNDRLTATYNGTPNTWSTARVFPSFSDMTYREFKVKFTSYMMVGFEGKETSTPWSTNYSQYSGQLGDGYSWYSAGQTYHANVATQAQSVYASGDNVGILFDTVGGRAFCYRNGKATKAQFLNLPKGKEYFPTISFYGPADSATLNTNAQMPKLPKGWKLPDGKKTTPTEKKYSKTKG